VRATITGMTGYWGPPAMGCRCCQSGPKEKYFCQPCDHVAKAPLGVRVLCPFCRGVMTNMGHRWRPGRKGKRTLAGSRHGVRPEESLAVRLLRQWGG
jgi:hypothetical protein